MIKLLSQLKLQTIIFFKDLKYAIVMFADEKFPVDERGYSLIKILTISGPIAFFLDVINAWFIDNRTFVLFVILAILINAGVGIWRHLKPPNTFSWETFLKKTGTMMAVLLVTYVSLEMILIIARQNMITEIFRIALQVSTLMYPLSKVFKSIYILTSGEYPPGWIMNKVYNFEKTGDLKEFMEFKKNNNENKAENEQDV